MFNLFRKKSSSPITVDFFSFDTFNWKKKHNYSNLKSWINNDKTAFIGIELSNTEYPYSTNEISTIIAYERKKIIASSSGGIISCKKQLIDGFSFIETICKEPISPDGIPAGVNYLGTLTLPLRNYHFQIILKVCENGITGLRDSTIFAKWYNENGEIKSHENGKIIGWSKDPYDESVIDGRPMNLSESQKYDLDFPDHPLSELRSKIAILKNNMVINPKLKEYILD